MFDGSKQQLAGWFLFFCTHPNQFYPEIIEVQQCEELQQVEIDSARRQ
jgi:hypothetical protein